MLTPSKIGWIEISLGMVSIVLARMFVTLHCSPGVALAAMLFGYVYVIAGCGAVARANGLSRWWGALGSLLLIGIVVVALLPKKAVDSDRRAAPYQLLIPAFYVAGICGAVFVLWLIIGNIAAFVYEKRENRLWGEAFHDKPKACRTNEAARNVETEARALGIDFDDRKKTALPPSLAPLLRRIARSEGPAEGLPADLSSFIDGQDRQISLLASTILAAQPEWDMPENDDAIRGVIDSHRLLLAASLHDRAAAEGNLMAATRLTKALLLSNDFIAVTAAAIPAVEEASVARQLGSRSVSRLDRRVLTDALIAEVELTVRAQRGGMNEWKPAWSRPFVAPFLRLAGTDFQRAWRERIRDVGSTCYGGLAEPRFASWNRLGRIASPEPKAFDRLYVAMLSAELTQFVQQIRETPGSIPRVGIRSALCSDVVWVVEKRPEFFEVSISKPFESSSRNVEQVALKYREEL